MIRPKTAARPNPPDGTRPAPHTLRDTRRRVAMPDATSVVTSWLDALEARDIPRMTDLLADDVTIEAEMMRTPIVGKKMLPAMIGDTMNAIESLRIDRRKIIASGRDAALLAEVHVRFGKDLEVYGEKIRAAGKSLDILSAAFVEVNAEGRISRITRVRDNLRLVQQLGISPERIAAMVEKLERQRRAA
ncbi:MAG TPA: nuclear transport factor 2 family protein [Longimicrobiales bacterium]|nr:nuclear transport factor 2 family protein [Longimicrobiales bacterium]